MDKYSVVYDVKRANYCESTLEEGAGDGEPISMGIWAGFRVSSGVSILIQSTPLSILAFTCSAVTPSGTRTLRSNEPYRRSDRIMFSFSSLNFVEWLISSCPQQPCLARAPSGCWQGLGSGSWCLQLPRYLQEPDP